MQQRQHNFHVHCSHVKVKMIYFEVEIKLLNLCRLVHAYALKFASVYGLEIFYRLKFYGHLLLVAWLDGLLVWPLIKISFKRGAKYSAIQHFMTCNMCHGVFQLISCIQFAACFIVMIFIRKSLNHHSFSMMMMMMTAFDLIMEKKTI